MLVPLLVGFRGAQLSYGLRFGHSIQISGCQRLAVRPIQPTAQNAAHQAQNSASDVRTTGQIECLYVALSGIRADGVVELTPMEAR